MQAVLTVVGKDKVGIFAKVSKLCADYNVNIEGVSQTILKDMFVMIMMCNIDNCTVPFGEFVDIATEDGKKNDLVIHVMHEDIFNSMHNN